MFYLERFGRKSHFDLTMALEKSGDHQSSNIYLDEYQINLIFFEKFPKKTPKCQPAGAVKEKAVE